MVLYIFGVVFTNLGSLTAQPKLLLSKSPPQLQNYDTYEYERLMNTESQNDKVSSTMILPSNKIVPPDLLNIFIIQI